MRKTEYVIVIINRTVSVYIHVRCLIIFYNICKHMFKNATVENVQYKFTSNHDITKVKNVNLISSFLVIISHTFLRNS